jgi:hypothetical protein
LLTSYHWPIWRTLTRLVLCVGMAVGLHAAMVAPAQASTSCTAVNSGAFNLPGTALGASSSSSLLAWAVGDQITLTLTSSDGISRADGLYNGSFTALKTTTVPTTGSANLTYTVVSADLTNGILVDPENNDSVTATCTPAAPAPTVVSVSPNTGLTSGGTVVSITGTSLTGATTVNFGGNAATSFTVNSATSVTATSPAGSAGVVDVTVTTPSGTSATSAADQFTYLAPPTVTGVSPNNGRTAGGTVVSITGTNLTGATAVNFGANVATSVTVNSATSITATSPASSTGVVDVTVITPSGTSATSAADQFTYFAPPAVTSITPSSGPVAGGTGVTITGANFAGATAVRFGTATASFIVNGAAQITATSPAGTAGMVDVTVTTPGGTSAASSADQFTYGGSRTWVSSVGNDANPCSRTAPCLTFAGAMASTTPGGAIDCIDPGDFGAVTINKALKIICGQPRGSDEFGEAGIQVSGTNGIVISAGPNDVVVLQGLDIEGLGTGLDGIKVVAGAQVYVTRCKIHHFTGNGINMASSTSGARLFVEDSFIFQNGTLNSNPLTGGVNVNGTANVGLIVDTVVETNQNFAVQASGASNVVTLTRTILSGSPNGINLVNGGASICFGPSNVMTNGSVCTSSITYK